MTAQEWNEFVETVAMHLGDLAAHGDTNETENFIARLLAVKQASVYRYHAIKHHLDGRIDRAIECEKHSEQALESAKR